MIKEIRWKTRGIVFSEGSEKKHPMRRRHMGSAGATKPTTLENTLPVRAPVPPQSSKNRVRARNRRAGKVSFTGKPPPEPPEFCIQTSGAPTSGKGAAPSEGGSPEPKRLCGASLPKVGDLGGSARAVPPGTDLALRGGAQYANFPRETFTLTFDWRNHATTEIRLSVLEDTTVGGSPTHFPFQGGWWLVRLVAVKNEDGSARTVGYVKLLKRYVHVLPENSSRPNRLNVYLVLACDASALVNPDLTWRGGILCKTGATATFNEGFEQAPTERVLTVPYTSGVTEIVEPVVMVLQQWWSPLRPSQEAAQRALPYQLEDGTIQAYTQHSMDRLRLAGLSAFSLWMYQKFDNFLQLTRTAGPANFVKSPSTHGGGYPDGMGSAWDPGPTGNQVTGDQMELQWPHLLVTLRDTTMISAVPDSP